MRTAGSAKLAGILFFGIFNDLRTGRRRRRSSRDPSCFLLFLSATEKRWKTQASRLVGACRYQTGLHFSMSSSTSWHCFGCDAFSDLAFTIMMYPNTLRSTSVLESVDLDLP